MNTMQQEFDAVVTHLFTQGRPAKGADGHSCLYRSGTLSCAVGCRIPDSAYTAAMDDEELYSEGDGMQGTGVGELILSFKERLPEEIVAYEKMFSRLQNVHDNAVTLGTGEFHPTFLADQLASVARQFDLTFTRPEGV